MKRKESMMYKVITFDKEEKYIHDFLMLPKILYSADEIVQNEKEEREILVEEHLLSKYFKICKLLVYKNQSVCARGVVTFYPEDSCAYIGFFESSDDPKGAKLLFEEAARLSKANNCSKIRGPVDASFWIKYRLKTNYFDKKAYISEPYNKNYYLDLFLASGYKVIETYVSNYYARLPIFKEPDKKSKERYQHFISKGYQICSPKKKDFDSIISAIYKLIITLYKDFPIFKSISEADFVQLFDKYRYILDFSFVKLTYYKGEAVGFVIGVPDYGSLLNGKIGFMAYSKMLLKKIRSSNYVILYMGVKPGHYGLGNAMTRTLVKNARKKRATAVGALIKEGKVTKGYVNHKITATNTYALLECHLSQRDESQ